MSSIKIGRMTERRLTDAADLLDQELQAFTTSQGEIRGEAKHMLKLKEDIEDFLENTVEEVYNPEGEEA